MSPFERPSGIPVDGAMSLAAQILSIQAGSPHQGETGLFLVTLENNNKPKTAMAIKVISNYAKRLGLPGYSSHQFSVSVETELSDLEELNAELSRLYHDLQEAVDREIQHTGFVPGEQYGDPPGNNGHFSANGTGNNGNGSPARENNPKATSEDWNCSDKQRSLIERLVRENNLDWDELKRIAAERFGVPLPRLNRLQASGLISELLEAFGNKSVHGQESNGKGGRR